MKTLTIEQVIKAINNVMPITNSQRDLISRSELIEAIKSAASGTDQEIKQVRPETEQPVKVLFVKDKDGDFAGEITAVFIGMVEPEHAPNVNVLNIPHTVI